MSIIDESPPRSDGDAGPAGGDPSRDWADEEWPGPLDGAGSVPADGAGDDDGRPIPPTDDTVLRRGLDAAVVTAACAFVFWQLHPNLIVAETTPAGGDMGAHVWAFAYLRDVLLPAGRFSGWTPDWYAGFPVFQYYMVVPFLGMVALNTGLAGAGALVPAGVSVAASVFWFGRGSRRGSTPVPTATVAGGAAVVIGLAVVIGAWTGFGVGFRLGTMTAAVAVAVLALRFGDARWRGVVATLAIAVAVLGVSLPYGPSFKAVTVAGVVAMPATAYVFARGARLPYPTPALVSVAVLLFLFDKNFTIYGGNIASTMAGEFAFSISLAVTLAYLGVLLHGLRTGTHRATAAVLLALVGLCHLLPAFFALAATAAFLLVHAVAEVDGRRAARLFGVAAVAVVVAGAVAAVVGLATTPPIVVFTIAGLAVVGLLWSVTSGRRDDDRTGQMLVSRTWWVVSAGAVSGLLAAWWVLPFFWTRTYLNDMGWEKIAVHRPGKALWSLRDGFVNHTLYPIFVPSDLKMVAALALVGAVLSVAFRHRVGTSLVLLGLILALAIVYVPQGRLWNARILPFWYLVIYLLAAVGVGEVARALSQVVARRSDRPVRGVTWVAAPVALVVVTVFLGGQLRNLPFDRHIAAEGEQAASYRPIGVLPIEARGENFVRGWANWNYSGFERKALYPEYRGIVDTMATVGRDRGCGMSLWEYSEELNNYGTPMALMLLPHWTDGCIGSMEGLYFEASSTTPFHFLMQSELSAGPSRAQRDLPYRELDIDAGVEHLQLMGVRYYMSRSAEATTAAAAHEDLTEVATSAPWTVFEVADAPLVAPATNQPAVTTAGASQHEWLCADHDDAGRCTGPALDWFQDASAHDVLLAADGPGDWERVDPGQDPTTIALPSTTVSDVAVGRDGISFSVSEPGVPVLVKQSYFPNWRADGAEGPWRVAPNLMVVVPTTEDVTLTFGRTAVDYTATLLTLLGVAAAVGLARRGRLPLPTLRREPVLVGPDAD